MTNLFTVALLFLVTACAHTPRTEKVAADLKAYDDKVLQMKAELVTLPVDPHNFEWVKKKLQHMVDVEQYMRKTSMELPYERGYSEEEKEIFNKEFAPRFKQIDKENTDDLKGLLKIYRWFNISTFGEVADNNAWLLVQYADEQPAFQQKVLKILTSLYKTRETSPKNYAYLFDRVAFSSADPSKRGLQRYGTQGSCTGRVWAPHPIEDPANVDKRRAEVGLGTMAEYIKGFKDICH